MNKPLRTQNWSQSLDLGDRGVQLVLDLLDCCRSTPLWYRTVAVSLVADDPNFQKLGIDLNWFVAGGCCTCCMTIEVKADQNEHTGNFFFETVSDAERNTPGAFLASTAEWYFYTFLGQSRVYCLPLYETRKWFLANESSFQERTARSSRGQRGWRTIGRLVPILMVPCAELGGRVFERTAQGWSEIIGTGGN